MFSAKAEYACLAMLELATRHGDPAPVSLKHIAETHQISQRFLVQIFLQLRASGLVTSTRGAAGGYHLCRPPEQITLEDIMQVIENNEPPPDKEGSDIFLTPLKRTLHGVWSEILTAQRKILSQTSLADLVQRAHHPLEPVYQI